MKGMTEHVDADKVMRALKKGTITYTGTIPYVRLDAVQDVLERLERICEMCGHAVHEYECEEPNGEYDHLNGFHECGCPGNMRCDFDCDQCHPDDEEVGEDYFDNPPFVVTGESLPLRPGIVKSHICTCLAPGMNYCEVHDES